MQIKDTDKRKNKEKKKLESACAWMDRSEHTMREMEKNKSKQIQEERLD